jgi:hypothetical protein
MSALFDVAAKTDLPWAQKWAARVPDAAARAGAYLDISRAYEAKSRRPAGTAPIITPRSPSKPRAKKRIWCRARAR